MPDETQERNYPYPDDMARTHWNGCWRERGHHNCAVAHIDRLTRERDEARAMAEGAEHARAVAAERLARFEALAREADMNRQMAGPGQEEHAVSIINRLGALASPPAPVAPPPVHDDDTGHPDELRHLDAMEEMSFDLLQARAEELGA